MRPSDKEFISESEEILEDVVTLLLDMQEVPRGKIRPDSVNALFRCMHTIKGLAGLYGYEGLSNMCHELESILDDLRLGRVDMTEDVFSFLITSADVVKSLFEEIRTGIAGRDRDVSEHVGHIQMFRESLRRRGEEKPSLEGLIEGDLLKVLSEYEEHRLRAGLEDGKGIYTVELVLSLKDFDTVLRQISERIKAIGELICTLPVSEGIADGFIGFKLVFSGTISVAKMKRKLKLEVVELVRRKEKSRSAKVPQPPVLASPKGSSTIVRVDISKLDSVLTISNELSVIRNVLQGLWEEMSRMYGHTPSVLNLYRLSQNFERGIAKLQQQVLQIRMVPLGQIFRKLSQVLRRSSSSLGRKINITVFGEHTEIDKYIAEEVFDPLVQIVRNAIDHGIEPARERASNGKEQTGNIRLKAFERGNNVVIEISDDGRGIDGEMIRRKAVERGILKEGDALSDQEVFDLLFTPGFSTKESPSEVSGRGVGLDIVKEKLLSLNGSVEVRSESGVGTTFALTLPITLAIVKALIVRVGSEKFAVPLSSMSETISVEQSNIRKRAGRVVYRLEEEVLPLDKLRDMLQLPGSQSESSSFAVVVGNGEKRRGLVVDELLGQREVVIKPLGGYFEDLKGISGAAEIGMNEVILVLDMESLIDEAVDREGATHV